MRRRRHSTGLPLLAAAAAAYAGVRLFRPAAADLAGRSVLITGGSRGLGLLLAREFGRHGCRVAICARDPVELQNAVRDLAGTVDDVLAIECDVADRDRVRAMVERVTAELGGIDVLVNNASVIQSGPLESMTVADFEEAMAANFWGTVYTTLAVLPQMRDRRSGRVVNITSIAGKVAVPHLLPYDCAKFATVGFSEGLRAELAGQGVAVTTVVPGLMRTGSPVNAFFDGDAEKEFGWFSLASATPLTAMSAERAARRIVRATRRGEAEVTLSWQAKLLRITHGLLPGTTADLLGLANRILPGPDPASDREAVRGMELDTPVAPSPLTAPMNRAARETNQYGGRPRPSRAHADAVGLVDESGRR